MAAVARSAGRTATKAAKKVSTKTAPKRPATKTTPAGKVVSSAAKKGAVRKPAVQAAAKPAAKPQAAAKPAAKKAMAKSAPSTEAKRGVQRNPAPPRAEGTKQGSGAKQGTGAKQSRAAESARTGVEAGAARRGPGRIAGGTVPTPRAPASAPVIPHLTEPVDPATLHLTAAPVLHRILTCHVPVAAVERLEASGESLFTAARTALQAGIRALEQDLTQESSQTGPASGERPHTRPIAVPAGLAAALLVTRLAEECFEGDVHVAGGWLVTRGAGLPVALPTPGGAGTRQTLLSAIDRLAASERAAKPGRSGRSTSRARAAKASSKSSSTTTAASGARVSAPLILVPAGPQLRAMREALGVSREEVAQVAGLTPDTVGEIERDRRPTAAARLQVAEVLCGMNPATRLEA